MQPDESFVQPNRASTERMRRLLRRLSEDELQSPVGAHWTVAIALAHLAFWDRRVLYALERTAKDGKLLAPSIDLLVNDLSLPLWAAIPPREAARLAIERSDERDKRLEAFPRPLLEEVFNYNKRWVMRSLHRNEHLDEVDRALQR